MSDEALPRLTNGVVELTLFPAAGGRLLSVRLAGREFLWQHPEYVGPGLELLRPRGSWPALDVTMASWVNVGGSKTWPAPQGWSGPHEWPGPPDPVLDSGHWTYRTWSEPGRDIAEVTSPYDPRTGLVITRRFELVPGKPGFEQVTTFRNHGRRPVTWSIWEVCQVPAVMDGSDHVEVSVAGSAGAVELLRVRGELPRGDVRGGVRSIPVIPVVGKLGLTDATGAVRFVAADGSSLSLTFRPVPGAEYPDGGCRVELWLQTALSEPVPELGGLHPRHDLVELEVLSPLTTLLPGESVRATLCWSFSAGPLHDHGAEVSHSHGTDHDDNTGRGTPSTTLHHSPLKEEHVSHS